MIANKGPEKKLKTIQNYNLILNNMKSRLSGTTDLSTATEKSSSSNKLEPSVASVHNNVESTRHVHGIPKKPMVSCYTVDDQQMDTLLDSSLSSSSQSSSHWSRHPAAESVLSHDEARSWSWRIVIISSSSNCRPRCWLTINLAS